MVHSSAPVRVAGIAVGEGHAPFILAEVGINHNGDRALAMAMIHAAHEAGADGVKFQGFTPDRLFNASLNPKAVELFSQWTLSREDFRALKAEADSIGIPFLCTPFDPEWVQFLDEELDLPAFKVASSDCTNVLLLEAVGTTGKPVILSTGMATLEEVRFGVDTLMESGCPALVLLHCVTQYPPLDDEINLRAIDTLAAEFPHPIGFSDHYVGNLAALGAIGRGACLIEKHFTTDRALPGPDQDGSADPAMLSQLVRDARALHAMLGDGVKEAKGREVALRTGGRPGLYAIRDLPAGHVLTRGDLYAARPMGDFAASRLAAVIGQTLVAPLAAHGSLAVATLAAMAATPHG